MVGNRDISWMVLSPVFVSDLFKLDNLLALRRSVMEIRVRVEIKMANRMMYFVFSSMLFALLRKERKITTKCKYQISIYRS
jgi:hypothetical protein